MQGGADNRAGSLKGKLPFTIGDEVTYDMTEPRPQWGSLEGKLAHFDNNSDEVAGQVGEPYKGVVSVLEQWLGQPSRRVGAPIFLSSSLTLVDWLDALWLLVSVCGCAPPPRALPLYCLFSSFYESSPSLAVRETNPGDLYVVFVLQFVPPPTPSLAGVSIVANLTLQYLLLLPTGVYVYPRWRKSCRTTAWRERARAARSF